MAELKSCAKVHPHETNYNQLSYEVNWRERHEF